MIDPKKKYKTRNGRDVRIYAVDAGGEYPVHGAVMDDEGVWDFCTWTEKGQVIVFEPDDEDLIEVKERGNYPKTIWVERFGHCVVYDPLGNAVSDKSVKYQRVDE